ncbi:HNH endonuclease [Neobacillus drentensis]|uniref:HNH endonuclease n=1 Tax=Neobacillus drentensis TaxID=220684 RepID=UPI002FFE3940
MIITPQKVTVRWNGGNRRHFESLGYVYTKRNDAFEVDVYELSEGSNYEVRVVCDFCHKEFPYPYSKYLRASNNRVGKVSCSFKECQKQLKTESTNTLRFSYQEVKEFYEQHGCELLEDEYKGYTVPMRFRCHCGEENEKTFERFKLRSTQCTKCANEQRIKESRYSYDEVYLYFKEHGCELLEETYFNNSQPLRYICECGNESMIRFDNFRLGNRCVTCGNKKRAESRRHTYDYVNQVFEDAGCKLIEKQYIDGHAPMRYICVCGREDKKTLQKFLSGQRCRSCYLDNNRGKNNSAWNPDKTDEEREFGRILEGYKQWKKDCLERDDYTCQVCNQRGRDLHIHHIFSYSSFKELRIDPLNGIVLCVDCHKGKEGFHGIYGNKDTTPDHFLDFLVHKGCLDTHKLISNRVHTMERVLLQK